jgi:hypothetical protein
LNQRNSDGLPISLQDFAQAYAEDWWVQEYAEEVRLNSWFEIARH